MKDLTLSTDTPAYRAIREYWSKSRSIETTATIERGDRLALNSVGDSIKEYNLTIVLPFNKWLATQGASIRNNKDNTRTYGVDSYNVACGTDELEFDTEANMVAFLLRWS